MLPRFLTVASIATVLALPALGLADEPENYEADARQSGGEPPTVPHRIADDATGESCNNCHRTGLNGAPVTSHPERMGCTQCHVQGEVKKSAKKAKGKK
jgi:cytochrome c-type protein NapB